MTNKEFAKVLKEKMEEYNLIQANEEFLVECVNDVEVARIKLNGDEVSMAVRLADTQKSVNERGWDIVLRATGEALTSIRKRAGGFMNKIDRIEDYTKIKDELIIRPVNYSAEFIQKNAKEPCMYCKKGDIALVLYLIMSDCDGILNTIKVPMRCVEGYKKQTGMKDLDIFAAAMENTVKNQVPMFYTDMFNITDGSGKKVLESKERLSNNRVTLVTTSRKTNGAIAMFCPGVKEKLAEMYGDSFYVAFTSIHEAMVHKVGSIDPTSIKRNVTETNRIFGPADTLSGEIFFFNKDTKEFTTVNC